MNAFAMRPVPAAGVALIKRFEGLHDGDKRTPILLEPQADPIGIYTVGWGYALFDRGRPVTDKALALRIWRERWPGGFTLATADALAVQVAQEVCDKIVRLLGAAAVNDHQLGAMVSLAYNIGVGERGGASDFADSSVLRRFLAGDKPGAADAFLMWNKARVKGVLTVLRGLDNRRRAERDLFLSPVA